LTNLKKFAAKPIEYILFHRLEAIFMLPVNSGGHSAYQNFVVLNLRKYYPNPDALARSTLDIIERFWNLNLSYTDEFLRNTYSMFGPEPRTPFCMQRSYLLSIDFKVTSLTGWAAQLKINPLYAILSGFEFGDTPGVGTFYDFLDRLLDSAHDAMAYYLYCRKNGIQPFIGLNEKRGISKTYKDVFIIGKDGVPICKAGRKMNHDGSEPSKARLKFRCPLASIKYRCSCENPCSPSMYGRTIHLTLKDNPRLINFPPRDSDDWKLGYNARTSSERSNKCEKIDFKFRR